MTQYWELVMDWDIDTGDAKNVLHYVDNAPATIDWQGVCDTIAGYFSTAYRETLSGSCTWRGITVREDAEGSVGVTYTPTAGGLEGQAGDDSYIPAVAALVRKRSLNTVRPNQGRVYQPGVANEEFVATGTLGSGAKSNIDAFWDDMILLADGGSALLQMVIKCRDTSKPNTVAYNPVAEVSTAFHPATQRRRMFGHGS